MQRGEILNYQNNINNVNGTNEDLKNKLIQNEKELSELTNNFQNYISNYNSNLFNGMLIKNFL